MNSYVPSWVSSVDISDMRQDEAKMELRGACRAGLEFVVRTATAFYFFRTEREMQLFAKHLGTDPVRGKIVIDNGENLHWFLGNVRP